MSNKILSFCSDDLRHFEFWKNELKIEIERVEATEDQRQHPELLQNQKGIYLAACLDELAGDIYVAKAKEAPTEVRDLGYADSLVFDTRHVWPRCFVKEALRLGITQSAPDLETRHYAYVTGSGPLMRVGVLVAVQMGFQNIAVVSADLEAAKKSLSFLKTRTFGIQFHWLKDAELTLQPNNGSLMINTLAPDSEDLLAQDLPYMNYLQRQGLVVTLSTAEGVDALAEEASNVGVKTLSGDLVTGLRDYLFLKAIGKAPDSQENYVQSWLKSRASQREKPS